MESEFGQLLAALLHTPMAALMSIGQNFAVMHSQVEAIYKLPPQAEQYDTPDSASPASSGSGSSRSCPTARRCPTREAASCTACGSPPTMGRRGSMRSRSGIDFLCSRRG